MTKPWNVIKVFILQLDKTLSCIFSIFEKHFLTSRYIDNTKYESTRLVVCLHRLTLNTECHVSIVETLNTHPQQEMAPA